MFFLDQISLPKHFQRHVSHSRKMSVLHNSSHTFQSGNCMFFGRRQVRSDMSLSLKLEPGADHLPGQCEPQSCLALTAKPFNFLMSLSGTSKNLIPMFCLVCFRHGAQSALANYLKSYLRPSLIL